MNQKVKTIFLTIFEGVEAKNLLRTPVLSTLLADPAVRVILFTKSAEKVEYYEKEFSDSRMIYELAPRQPISGWDAVFAKLKFTLLRTVTTDLKRRLNYEREKNFFRYFGGLFANRFLAWPSVRKVVRWLDFILVRQNFYAPFFEKYQPDLVFCAHLFDEPEIALLREAKKRGVKTVGLINSWDKTTARCILRLLPDKAIVFNEIVKREMIKYNEMSADALFVSGLPQYDIYWQAKPSSREEFFNAIGIGSEKKLIVYAPMGRAFGGCDFEVIDLLRKLLVEGKFGNDAELLVRFQPNDFFEKSEIEKRPDLKFDYPGKRFGSARGVDWDMDEKDIGRLVDTLAHASVFISYASSIVIDAAIFGKPAINIDFEISKDLKLADRPTQYYQTAHYQNVLAIGGVRLVKNVSELTDWTKKYLANSALDKEARERLIKEQCQFTDGKSGERLGRFILELIK
ncbi:MAG: hypothetical protein CEO19_197 [Parcubacteria group bacterium Gr01-1014_73]|nr:MAG: hypothetical protein CEO19_197 [Parcubacteria group bacterium Gr01-1014_73]